MNPEEQKNNKKSAPKKINWNKAQRIAGEVTLVATTAFISGVAMAAGQRLIAGFFNQEAVQPDNVVTLSKARTAI